MSVERYSGISSDLLLNNALDIINLVGTGRNNNQSGKVYINNILKAQTVSRGLNLYVFDENLNLLSSKSYDLSTANNVNMFVTDVYNLPSRRYFAIISYEDIKRDNALDALFRSKGGDLWFEAWSKYEFENPSQTQARARIPYAAFGCTELGITHETYGNYKPNSNNHLAELVVMAGDYDRFGSTGFGRSITTIGRKTLGVGSATDTFSLADFDDTFIFTARAKADNRDAQIVITDTPSISSGLAAKTYTVDIDKNVFDTFRVDIPVRDPDSNYTIKQISNSTLDIEFIQVKRSTNDTSTEERVSCVVKRNGGFSVKDIIFSNNGNDIANDSMLNNMTQDDVLFFNTNSSEIVCRTNKPSLTINGVMESDYVSVNEYRDYCVLAFIKAHTIPTNVKFTISAYDASYNPLSIQTATTSASLLLVNETNINTESVVFFENYLLSKTAPSTAFADFSSNMYGDVALGGYEHPVEQKDAVRMVTGVEYVKIKVETDQQVTLALPVITQMKYVLTKDSVFIGGLNQSLD